MAFNLTANLNVAVNTGALKSAANQINSALNTNANLKLGVDKNSFSGIRQVKTQIEEATNSMENFGKQAGFAAKRFSAFAVSAGSIIAFISTMKEAVSTAIDFDREMIRLSQVSNDSIKDVADVGKEITRLSTGLGVSSQDLIKVAVTLKQANLSLKDTKIALEAMAQAALAPNFDNLKDTTEGAIAIMNQFKISASELSGALGAVNVVAGEFAVEAGDIIEAVRKTGGAFKAAGGNLNELIALFTAVRQTTRESAESIGTGLRTIFTRIQRNDTANALKQVGIELRYTASEAKALGDAGLENQFVGPYEAIKRLSAGLSELRSTDPRFSAIVEQLGGYRQISKVIPLIQEFATAQKALGIAQAGSVSLALNAGQAQDALGIKLQKLKETFFDVGRSIVNNPGFRSLTESFISVTSTILSLIDSLKSLIPLIATIATIKITQGITSFAKGFISGATSEVKSIPRKADGGFIRMQKGGIVPGSGSGDKIPTLLEPGELVIPRKYVSGGSIYRQRFMEGKDVRSKPFPKGLYPEEILGFPRGYIPEGKELTSAFRKAALIHHSDRGGLPENMAQVNAAFQRLKDRNDLKTARSQSGPKKTSRNTSSTPPPKNSYQSEDDIYRAIFGDAPSKASARSAWQGKNPEIFTKPNMFDSWEAVRQPFNNNEDKVKTENASRIYQEKMRARRGFAFGGLVPGVGNSDTVPMELDEGSFVIKKSSVNKIGVQNLANINKFASGGKVPSLLTPGEYVYSPSEANKIGATKLHQMNNYGKLKRFGIGGSAGKPPLISDVYLKDPQNIDKIFKALLRQIMSRDPNKSKADAELEANKVINDIKIQNQIYNKSIGDISNAEKNIATEKSNIGIFNTDLKDLRSTLASLKKESTALGKSLSKNAEEATKLTEAESKLNAKIAQLEAEKTTKQSAPIDLTREQKRVDSAQMRLDDLKEKRAEMDQERQAKIDEANKRLADAEQAKRIKETQPANVIKEKKAFESAKTRLDDLQEKRIGLEEKRQEKIDAAKKRLKEAEDAKKSKELQPVDITKETRRVANITGNINVLKARREERLDRGQSTDVIDAQIEEQKRRRRLVQSDILKKQAAGPDTKKEQAEIDKARMQLNEASKPLDSAQIDKRIEKAKKSLSIAEDNLNQKILAGADTTKEQKAIDKAKQELAEANKPLNTKSINKKIGRAESSLTEAQNTFYNKLMTPVDTSKEDNQILKLKNELLELEKKKAKNTADLASIDSKMLDNSLKTDQVEKEILKVDNDILAAKQRISTLEATKEAAIKEGAKAAGSFTRDAKGRIVDENGRVIGKKTSDAGTLKESIREEQKRTGATGKDAKAFVAQKMIEDYQEKAFNQQRSLAKAQGVEFDPELARAKAADLARSSARGRATIQRDAKGNIIGDERLANQLSSLGKDPSGKSGFFERISERFGFGGPKIKLTEEQKIQRSAERRQNIAFYGQSAAFGAATLGAYFANAQKERGGSAESVVGRGNVFGAAPVEIQGRSEAFKANLASASSLEKATSYGAAGAVSGAVFGPLGLAIGGFVGAVVGATKGYTDGLKEAESQIRDVKIAKASENLQNIFERVGNGLQDFDASIANTIRANQKVLQEEGGKKAFDIAGGNRDFIDRMFKGELNTQELQTQLEKNSRENQARQLIGLTSILNKQAEKTGRMVFNQQIGNGANAENINFDNLQEGIKKNFLEANAGFNKEAIIQIASAKNITFEAAEREFIKVIKDSFKSAQVQKTQELAVKANINSITSMEMLANSVNAAALASEVFSEKMKTNTSLFEGSISGTTITSLSNQLSSKSTPDFSAYNKALDQIASSLGTYGKEFRDQGNALNVASQELPSILANVVENPISGADAGVQIAEALTRALEAKGIKGETASRIVNSVTGGIAGQDYSKFLADTGGNVAKAAEKLLENLKGPFLQTSKDIADKLQNASNSYIQGLVDLANRQKQVRQSFESVDSKKLQRDKFLAEQKAKAIGLPSQASEFISYERMTQGFKNKQLRLTENVVGGSEDPREIYKRLQKVQEQIKPQEEKVQQASLSEKGGETFRNAANELLKLKSEASNLNEALKNLSDQSDRLSAAQEKLAKIQKDRENELSLGRKLLTGGSETRQRFVQGQQLFNIAQKQGFNIRNFNDEQAKILFEFVDNFGEKGKDISDQIVKSTTGLGVGSKAKQKEEASLTNEIVRIMNAQVEAQQLLTANQKTLQQEYFTELNKQNSTFYSKLDAFIVGMQEQQKRGFINVEERNLAKAKSTQEQTDFLRKAGVTDENFSIVNKNKGLITEIVDFNKRKKSSTEVVDRIKTEKEFSKYFFDSLDNIKAGGNRLDNAKQYATNFELIKSGLSQLGIQGDIQKNSIMENFYERLSSKESVGKKTEDILKEAIIQGLASSSTSEERTLNEKLGKTGNADLFRRIAAQAEIENIGVDKINSAIEAATNLGGAIDEKLTAAIKRAQDALNRLNAPAAPALMPAAPAANPNAFSLGGSVFKPKGSDIVPAMLTPGEFVVNKNATQKNLPLLKSINSGKTSYLSKGGQVSYFDVGGIAPFPQEYPSELTKYNKFLRYNDYESSIEYFKNLNPKEITPEMSDVLKELADYNKKTEINDLTNVKLISTAKIKIGEYTNKSPLNDTNTNNQNVIWSPKFIEKKLIQDSLKAMSNFYTSSEEIRKITKYNNSNMFRGDYPETIPVREYEESIKPDWIKNILQNKQQIEEYINKFYGQDNTRNIEVTQGNAKDIIKTYEEDKGNFYLKSKITNKLKQDYFNDQLNPIISSIDKNLPAYKEKGRLKNLDKLIVDRLYDSIQEDKTEILPRDTNFNLMEWKKYSQMAGGIFGPPNETNYKNFYPFWNWKNLNDAKNISTNEEYQLRSKESIGSLPKEEKKGSGLLNEIYLYTEMIRKKKDEYENNLKLVEQQQNNMRVNIAAGKDDQEGGVNKLLNDLNIDELDAIIVNPKTTAFQKTQAKFQKQILKKIGAGSYYGGKNLVSNKQIEEKINSGKFIYRSKDLIKNLKDKDYGKKISMEDTVLQSRRGDPQKLAEIFKRRQNEANVIVGKILFPKKLENINENNQDAILAELNQAGADAFRTEDNTKIISENSNKIISEAKLKQLPEQQLAVIKSYVENLEFNKSASLKGKDFLDLVTSLSKPVAGKENEENGPRQLIGFEDYLKARLKIEDDNTTFEGSKDIIEAKAKGRYKALMLQNAELKRAGVSLTYGQLVKKVEQNKNFNIVDKLAANQKIQKTRFTMPIDGALIDDKTGYYYLLTQRIKEKGFLASLDDNAFIGMSFPETDPAGLQSVNKDVHTPFKNIKDLIDFAGKKKRNLSTTYGSRFGLLTFNNDITNEDASKKGAFINLLNENQLLNLFKAQGGTAIIESEPYKDIGENGRPKINYERKIKSIVWENQNSIVKQQELIKKINEEQKGAVVKANALGAQEQNNAEAIIIPDVELDESFKALLGNQKEKQLKSKIDKFRNTEIKPIIKREIDPIEPNFLNEFAQYGATKLIKSDKFYALNNFQPETIVDKNRKPEMIETGRINLDGTPEIIEGRFPKSETKDKSLDEKMLFYLKNLGESYIQSKGETFDFGKIFPNSSFEEKIESIPFDPRSDDFIQYILNRNNKFRKVSNLTIPYGNIFDNEREASINELKNTNIKDKLTKMVQEEKNFMQEKINWYQKKYKEQIIENEEFNDFFVQRKNIGMNDKGRNAFGVSDADREEIANLTEEEKQQNANPKPIFTEQDLISQLFNQGWSPLFGYDKNGRINMKEDNFIPFFKSPQEIAAAKQEMDDAYASLAQDKLDNPNTPYYELKAYDRSNQASAKYYDLVNPPLTKPNGGREKVVPFLNAYNPNGFGNKPEESGEAKYKRLHKKTPQEIENDRIMKEGPKEGKLIFDRYINGLRPKGNPQQEKYYDILQNYLNSPSFRAIKTIQDEIDKVKLEQAFDAQPEEAQKKSREIYLREASIVLNKFKSQDMISESYKKYTEMFKNIGQAFINSNQQFIDGGAQFPLTPQKELKEGINPAQPGSYGTKEASINLEKLINPENKSRGGLINYLSGGGVPSYAPNPNPSFFKPKGTDTVPAMLSPGEFVINAAATAKHGDLLHAINSGQDVGYSYTGGLIKYLAYGGSLTSLDKQFKKYGVNLKDNFEQGDIQKQYEKSLAIFDAIRNLNNENMSKFFEKYIGFNFFNGSDANKKQGIPRVGDTGVFAEGPKELGVASLLKSIPIQLPKFEKQELPQKKQPIQPFIPLPPVQPETKPTTQTTQGSQSEEKNQELALNLLFGEVNNISKGGMPKSRTDTIPAMLTPGEFVVNAKSSAKNSSLLHAINSGKEVDGFAQGGVVGYYAGGKTSGGKPSVLFNVAANMFSQSVSRFDSVLSKINAPTNSGYISIAKSSFDELSRILKTEIKVSSEPIKDFDRAVNNFGQNTTGFINNFGSSLEKFKGYINELNTVINTIPSTINLEVVGNLSASLNVDFNTQSVFLAVTNAVESLKGFIVSEIDKQINDEMF